MPVHMIESQVNAANGVAGLNGASRTTKGADSSDDLIIAQPKGIVLQDALGNYWRLGVTNLGVLSITSLGATKP